MKNQSIYIAAALAAMTSARLDVEPAALIYNFSHELNMANIVGTFYEAYFSTVYSNQDCWGRSSSLYGADNIDFSVYEASHNGEYRSIPVEEIGSIKLAPRALLRVFADEIDVGKVPSKLYGTYFNESLSNWECVNLENIMPKLHSGFITFSIDHNITPYDLMI